MSVERFGLLGLGFWAVVYFKKVLGLGMHRASGMRDFGFCNVQGLFRYLGRLGNWTEGLSLFKVFRF